MRTFFKIFVLIYSLNLVAQDYQVNLDYYLPNNV